MYLSHNDESLIKKSTDEILFEEDSIPSNDFFIQFFNLFGQRSLFSQGNHWSISEDARDMIISDRRAFRWMWNSNKHLRYKLVDNLSVVLNNRKASLDVKTDMQMIVDVVFSSLPQGVDISTERIITHLNPFASNKKSALKEYTKYKMTDNLLKSVWKEYGVERSNEVEFFDLIWSEIERSSGYTNSQKNIIAKCAANCLVMPDRIVQELSNGGYDSVKGHLVSHICGAIKTNISILKKETDSLAISKINERLSDSYRHLVSVIPSIKDNYSYNRELVIEVLPKEHLPWVASSMKTNCPSWLLSKLEAKLTE